MLKSQPTARQCMLLFLRAIQDAEERLGKSIRLVRLPRGALRRLWVRERLTDQFLQEVQGWLLSAGWALIDAGSTFGAVKTGAVKNWPRISTNKLEETLKKVREGEFGDKEFAKLEEKFVSREEEGHEDEEE